jgi:hypothetical protein
MPDPGLDILEQLLETHKFKDAVGYRWKVTKDAEWRDYLRVYVHGEKAPKWDGLDSPEARAIVAKARK